VKNVIIIAGVSLIVIGAAVLGFDHYSYNTTETVLKVGPVTATAERTNTVSFPPLLGWLLVVGGACALGFAAYSKKS
jgi:hypothetical protein